MLASSWQEVLDNLRPHKGEEEVAVHKPLLLLMILARAKRGEANEFRFRDLVMPLEKALQDLTLSKGRVHSEYPFWRLRTDGCWIIDNENHFIGLRTYDGPTRKDFLDNDAVGRVPDDLWKQLLERPALIDDLLNSILTTYFSESSSRELALSHSGLANPQPLPISQAKGQR